MFVVGICKWKNVIRGEGRSLVDMVRMIRRGRYRPPATSFPTPDRNRYVLAFL
jgi:hypothetical protein